jgi:MFS transporter, FSR family, fosmidomycin resistance protein
VKSAALSGAGGDAPDAAQARERWVNGLIGAGHLLSHFYIFALPPLFPLLKAEFGVSYVELGLAMTAYNLLGGVLQAPVGFLVDRLGPRRVLLSGLCLTAASVMLMGFVDTYAMLLVLALVAGLGNSVFHPADYAILTGSIDPNRLGRAFSLHTFAGYLGSALAPVTMLALAQWADWRMALSVSGAVGLAVLAVMIVRREVLQGEDISAKDVTETETQSNSTSSNGGIAVVLSPAVLLFLLYFILFAMGSSGLTAFTVSALINLHGLGLEQANAALTAHLFGMVGGILLAGIIADRYVRHLVTAAGSLVLAAVSLTLVVVLTPPGWVLIVIMTVAGVGLGGVLPVRDLMIRAVTPPGQSGKVFGFVFVGYAIGSSTAPVLYGWFLDAGAPALVFFAAAGFAMVALGALIVARRVGDKAANN